MFSWEEWITRSASRGRWRRPAPPGAVFAAEFLASGNAATERDLAELEDVWLGKSGTLLFFVTARVPGIVLRRLLVVLRALHGERVG